MAEQAVELTEAQRRSLGGVFARIVDEARVLGIVSGALSKLEQAVAEMSRETAAIVPPGRSDLSALLAELYVLVWEMKPRGLRAYGDLSPEAAAYVERATARLEQLAGEVIDHAEGRR